MALDLSKLSDAELQAISSGNLTSLSDETLRMIAGEQAPTAQPAGDYRTEALRRGFAGTVGAVSGMANVVFDTLSKLGIDPLRLSRQAAGRPVEPTAATIGEAFTAGRAGVEQPLMQALGSTGAMPQTGGQRIIAGGLEAVASPESYLFPPLAGVRRMGVLGQAVMRPTEQLAIGAGGQAGAIGGEEIQRKATGETGMTGSILGGLLGGATSAYGLGTFLKAGPLAGKGWDVAKGQWEKIRGTVPEDELLKDVDNRISNIFIAAGAADPNFLKVLEEAAKAQKGASLKAPGGQQIQMPISALLADNPVINTFIQGLSAKDPVFRAQYGQQFQSAKDALVANQIRLFGDPTKVSVNLQPTDLSKIQARKIQSLDEQLQSASRDYSIDPNMAGQRIENLVLQKEKEARAKVQPLYAEAFDIAKQKNVELPAASIDDIYNFVAGEQASDIFKTFPSIYNRVRAKFRPETTEPSAILTEAGAPMRPGGVKFAAATVEDLDSLKREINSQLRKANDPADIRLLSELKNRVGGHIDALDQDFVTAYRNADSAYLQNVGLPFSAETLKSVDRKKFVEQIVPAIIGNKSNVDEFIRVTGTEGQRVAKDVFLDSFTKAALKNDVIDPKAANKWLAKNRGGVSLIPGLEDEIRASVADVQALISQKNRLNADFQRVAGEQLLGKEGFSSPQQLVSKMYNDLNFTTKFMSNSGYGQNKDAVNAVRSFMLDDIVQSGDPIGLLNDRNKAAVFNRVFGPTYAQKVADFATTSNRLLRDVSDVSFRGETVPRTPIETITGIPPEQIISRIYNPVSGVVYAVTSLMSKYWANQASKQTEEKLKTLLLNPSDAVKVFQAIAPKAQGFDQKKIQDAIEIGKKYGVQWVADAVNDLRTGAARGATQQMEPVE
jgi:hypothetical protein